MLLCTAYTFQTWAHSIVAARGTPREDDGIITITIAVYTRKSQKSARVD